MKYNKGDWVIANCSDDNFPDVETYIGVYDRVGEFGIVLSKWKVLEEKANDKFRSGGVFNHIVRLAKPKEILKAGGTLNFHLNNLILC